MEPGVVIRGQSLPPRGPPNPPPGFRRWSGGRSLVVSLVEGLHGAPGLMWEARLGQSPWTFGPQRRSPVATVVTPVPHSSVPAPHPTPTTPGPRPVGTPCLTPVGKGWKDTRCTPSLPSLHQVGTTYRGRTVRHTYLRSIVGSSRPKTKGTDYLRLRPSLHPLERVLGTRSFPRSTGKPSLHR